MEGQKKASWAEESDDDWSDQEHPAPEQKSQVTAHSSRREALIDQVKSQSLPFTLYLSNLAYRLSEHDLLKELQVSESADLKLESDNGKPTGHGTIRVTNLDDALKVAEKFDADIGGRPFIVDLSNSGYYNRSSGRGRGSGRRGNRRGGGRRNYDDYKGYEKSYENRGYGKYQERHERGGERNYHKNPSREEEKQQERNYTKRFENKGKVENKGKITIAPSDDTSKVVSAALPPLPKPKSNPFGDAKPVDTLNRDIEFEKKLETEKKTDDEPVHEKKYKIKDTKEFRENVEGRDNKEAKENEVQAEVKETLPKAEEPADKVEKPNETSEKVNESEEQESFSRHSGQRRGRRGNYRKKTFNRPEHERRKDDEGEHLEGESRNHDTWGAENTEDKHEDHHRGYDRSGYNKRPYDDRRQNDSRRGQYDKRNEKRGNRNFEERKNEEKESGYVRHYENNKKEGAKVNAWGNPDISAEILKKPKEAKSIQEEEKQTKKGTTYIKKSYKDLGSQ